MASTYLTRTPSSAGNRKTFTWSGWVKRSLLSSASLFSAYTDDPNRLRIAFNGSDQLIVFGKASSSTNINLTTTQVFRDPSAWYHIVVTFDTTQSTDTNRIKVYVNGSQVTSFTTATYPSQNYDTLINSTTPHYIGQRGDSTEYLDGYIAHAHFTDGYAYAASTFGSTATNGQWVPNETPSVTYGTNGYFLRFTNASDLGEDSSGNNNDYTKSGSGDKVLDNPENVFATLSTINPSASNFTISEGNLKVSKTGTGTVGLYSQTLMPTSGKWYFEVKIVTRGSSDRTRVGIANYESVTGTSTIQDSYSGVEISTASDDKIFIVVNGSTTENTTFYTALSDNDIVRFAVDMDNGRLYIGVNGNWWNYSSSQTGGDPTSGSGYVTNNTTIFNGSPMTAYTGHSAGSSTSNVQQFNFGNPPYSISSGNTDENGYGNFEYAPPTGYLAICTNNVSSELSPTIDDGSDYFNTLLWTGNGSTRSITGLGFSPDWVWIKDRGAGSSHVLYDTIRGVQQQVSSDNENAELTREGVTAFDSDGFSLGTYANVNDSGLNFVGWSWRGSDSSAVSNTDGSITSTVSVNTTAGFSIVTFTSPSAGTYTIGHGLSTAPDLVIYKARGASSPWWTFFTLLDGSVDYVALNSTGAKADDSASLSAPTSSVFSLVNNYAPTNTTAVAYCFHSVEGYSKIGKYTGNGIDNDGPMVYLGYKPSFLLVKNITNSGEWGMFDSARNTFNVVNARLEANSSGAEYSGDANRDFDFLSNGFKVRNGSADVFNTSGDTFMYMAFAENPFVDSSGIPVTAR